MKADSLREKAVRNLLPPLAGLVLVLLFTSLGFWQLDRAEQKQAIEDAFENPGDALPVNGNAQPELYQPLSATGRWLPERQFLIDNTILGGQLGYYVITPLQYAIDEPLLLVNRGWLPKRPGSDAPSTLPAVEVPGAVATVTGIAGRLPRVGIRAGEAFQDQGGWPRIANWPSLDELAEALDREVLPFVLLEDPDPAVELARRWEPQHTGPARHIGYAVQWFALALTVIAIAVVLYRRKQRQP
ncbi:MAG: SURF1 family protein [Woeseia sp.]